MLEKQVFADVFEESFTGQSFVMKEVFTKKSIVKSILTKAKKMTLKELNTNFKRVKNSNIPNQLSAKQHVTLCEKTVDPTFFKKSSNAEAIRHFGKDACLVQDVVMFLIPFKSASRSSRSKETTLEYTFWHVTDLQENFGVLVTSDKQIPDACMGELWAIMNPTFLPRECDAIGSLPKQTPITSRLVFFTNEILRIGLLSGFQLCLHICANGSVCGTPFYHRQDKEDGHLKALSGKCPRHRNPKKVSLMTVKSSLCKKRSFYASDNSPKYPCIKKHCSEERSPDMHQNVSEKLMESTYTSVANYDTDVEKPSISEITLASLTSFLQDFLQNVKMSKNDLPETLVEKKKESIQLPKNLDLRIQHVIKRLNQFIALNKQYSSTNCQNMLSLLLKLVKQLVGQVAQYRISNKVKTKLDSVIFFTKRYISAHFQSSPTLPLVKQIP